MKLKLSVINFELQMIFTFTNSSAVFWCLCNWRYMVWLALRNSECCVIFRYYFHPRILIQSSNFEWSLFALGIFRDDLVICYWIFCHKFYWNRISILLPFFLFLHLLALSGFNWNSRCLINNSIYRRHENQTACETIKLGPMLKFR